MRLTLPIFIIVVSFVTLMSRVTGTVQNDADVKFTGEALPMFGPTVAISFLLSIFLFAGEKIMACATEQTWWMFRVFGKLLVYFVFSVGFFNMIYAMNQQFLVELINPLMFLLIFAVESYLKPSLRLAFATDVLYYVFNFLIKGSWTNRYVQFATNEFILPFLMCYLLLLYPVKRNLAKYQRADFARYDISLRQNRHLQKKEYVLQ